jgi:F0F1-type ATP synthase assembly protein I
VEENQHSGDRPLQFPPLFEFARKSAKHLLRLESALLILLALYLAISALVKGVSAPGALAGEIAFSIIAAIGLFICSKAFASHRSYGRAPALLANLIALGVAYFMISGKLVWIGFALALLAALTALSALLGYTE